MMNEMTILGAYGVQGEQGGSSSFLINDSNTIDAGNILKPLKERSVDIDTIWLTHSHLDHIIDIAYIIDNYFEKRSKTLKIRGLHPTLKILKKHFFNHSIWPDFSQIPLNNSKEMTISYEPINLDRKYTIDQDTSIRAFRTDHTVPSCGYIISKKNSALLISADTHDLSSVVNAVNNNPHIKTLVIECSFPSDKSQLAKVSKHLTPALLFERLQLLEGRGIKLYVNHIKPAYEAIITREIKEMQRSWDATILKDGDSIYY